MLRSILLITVLIGIGGALGGLLYTLRVEPPRRNVATLPPLVESVVVQAEEVVEWFPGYGTANAFRIANLSAEVAATVVERVGEIRAGSKVTEGQVLVRLDDRQYRRAYDRVKARADAEQASLDELSVEAKNLELLVKTAEQELRVARDERTRVAGLFERALAAKKEYDFASLAYQRARRVLQGYQRELAKTVPRRARLAASKRGYEADAALAQLNIERCEIRSPFAGHIGSLMVDVGDRVGPGSPVLTLVDSSLVEIPIQLRASVYDRVRISATCRVLLESMPDAPWGGEVARIAPAADQRTRTFAAYVVVDNAKQQQPLVPGMFVRAEVRGPVHPDGILVPRRAIRNGKVFVVENDTAQERLVTTERLIEDRALVNGGLRSGDRVILSHLDTLADGSPVRIRALSSAAPGSRESSQHSRLDASP